MATQFLQSNLWDKITFLAKRAKHRFVAVAYLGKGASDLLPLKRGDVLVVDMSLAAIRSGQTNPFEIDKYLKRGVEVHSYANLHAKVFVFDGKAIIGSANASHNSSDNLVEAAVLTTDKDVVSAARGFVRSLMGEQITPAYLQMCKKNFRPPQSSIEHSDLIHPTLWVQRNYPLKREDQKLDRAYKKGLPTAKKRLKNQRQFTVEDFTYSARSKLAQEAKLYDLFISIWQEENGQLWVYPPCRIVNFKDYTTQRGAKRKLIFLEMPKSPKCLKWELFRNGLRRCRIPRPGKHMRRAITDPDSIQTLLGLWKSYHDE